MNALEAARRMADIGVKGENCRCIFCGVYICDQWQGECLTPHAPSQNHPHCISQGLPQIVAALEAAELLVENNDGIRSEDQGYWSCIGCTEFYVEYTQRRTASDRPHAPDCRYIALVDTLTHKVVPQDRELTQTTS